MIIYDVLARQQQTSPGRRLREPQAPQQQSSHGSEPVSPVIMLRSSAVIGRPSSTSLFWMACCNHTCSQSMHDGSIVMGWLQQWQWVCGGGERLRLDFAMHTRRYFWSREGMSVPPYPETRLCRGTFLKAYSG